MLISGCSYTNTDIQELMMPPRLTGDEAKIQNAISESANNKSHTFKYPQRGDYRSAIIMYDIDGDGMNEAIAFYQMDFTEVNDINIVIIDQKDDQWEQIAMFKVPASDIDNKDVPYHLGQRTYDSASADTVPRLDLSHYG